MAASVGDIVGALVEARKVLALCGTRRVSAPEDEAAHHLGERIGYGALMSSASREWARMFDGTPQEGAQHTHGPSEATVKRTLALIDEALSDFTNGREQLSRDAGEGA